MLSRRIRPVALPPQPFGPPGLPRCRSYASEADPYRWPRTAHPTPYEILEMAYDAPYTKARYVELVKIYHPDHGRHRAHPPHCPHHVRMERFRLAVNANRILSDTKRRALYDRYGAGWGEHHRHRRHPHSPQQQQQQEKWWQAREGFENAEFAHAYGRGGRDDTSHNATWEDWERWYAARTAGPATGGKQQELHARNGVFYSVVVALAAGGTLAEIKYATGAGSEALELSEKQSVELGRDIARRRRETMDSGDREERVRRFLFMRDPVEARKIVGPPNGERKLLAPPPPAPASPPSGEQR